MNTIRLETDSARSPILSIKDFKPTHKKPQNAKNVKNNILELKQE